MPDVGVFVAAESDEGTAVGIYPTQLDAIFGVMEDTHRSCGDEMPERHVWTVEVHNERQADVYCRQMAETQFPGVSNYRIMKVTPMAASRLAPSGVPPERDDAPLGPATPERRW